MEAVEPLESATAAAIDDAEFDAQMSNFGGFESAPHIAVAISGGSDSTALALLLDRWTRRYGGRLHAFTVDHGLRPESGREARTVSRLMAARGVHHEVMRWQEERRNGNLQARARQGRYELLTAACRRNGILHLALAHHLEDQAETLMLRLGRGSGLDGLAAMPPVSFAPDLRMLRPLLGFPKQRLQATCRRFGAEWIEDPSNDSAVFARVRMRRELARLEPEGFCAERLAETAGHLGAARQAIEQDVAVCLARHACLHPAGYLWLDPEGLREQPAEIALRALARVLMTVGGAGYPPRFDSLERLYARSRVGLERARTLGGCRILPRRSRWLIVRETSGAESQAVAAQTTRFWDGRFVVRLEAGVPKGATLRALGEDGWRLAGQTDSAINALPAPARGSLPALFAGEKLLEVAIPGYEDRPKERKSLFSCRLRPRVPLAPQCFTVALRSGHII